MTAVEVLVRALPFLFTGAMTVWHGRDMYERGKRAGRRETEVELLVHQLVIQNPYEPGTGVVLGATSLPGRKKKPASTAD